MLLCRHQQLRLPEDATVLRRAHSRLAISNIREGLLLGLHDVGNRIHRGARVLERSATRLSTNITQALKDTLVEARLPVGLLPMMLAAYHRDPHPSVFGITQAITLGAQDASLTPEDRIALERAAGDYLRRYVGDV